MTVENPTTRVRYAATGNWKLGEHHHRAVLTDLQVHEIRDARELRHLTCRQIALQLGVKYETVRAIVYYKRRTTPDAHSLGMNLE